MTERLSPFVQHSRKWTSPPSAPPPANDCANTSGRLTSNHHTQRWEFWSKKGVLEFIDEVPSMPKELFPFLSSQREVFENFIVEAGKSYKQGTMQMLRIVFVS